MIVKLLLAALLLFALWALLRSRFQRWPASPPGQPVPMPRDEKEARALLGVGANADDDAIRAAHRRLVTDVHPDKGGSEELARRVNAARDLLLKR